jgi:hypothetical protein
VLAVLSMPVCFMVGRRFGQSRTLALS